MRTNPIVVIAFNVCWLLSVTCGLGHDKTDNDKAPPKTDKNEVKAPQKMAASNDLFGTGPTHDRRAAAGKRTGAVKPKPSAAAQGDPFGSEPVRPRRAVVRKRPVTAESKTPRIVPPTDNSRAAAFSAVSAIDQAARTKIENALDANVVLSFDDVPLSEVVDYLQQTSHIPIVIDKRALDEVGLTPDAAVSLQLKGVSLRSALRLILRGMDLGDLGYLIKDGLLAVTSCDRVEVQLELSVYPVADLLRPAHPPLLFAENSDQSASYDTLVGLITSVISPDSWDIVGGTGSVEPLPSRHALIVGQTNENQQLVANLLSILRGFRAHNAATSTTDKAGATDPCSVLPIGQRQAESHILKQLSNASFAFQFHDAPLSEVAQFVTQTCQIPIQIDKQALDDVGISSDIPVTAHLSKVPLRSFLNVMLEQLELTYVITDEVLLITTPEEAESESKIRVYPVTDLVQIGDATDTPDYDSLIRTIITSVEPDKWSDVGGAGMIEPFPLSAVLVIAQTDQIHQKVENLLAALRRAQSPVAHAQKAEPTPRAATVKNTQQERAPVGEGAEQYLEVYETSMVMCTPQQMSNAIRALVAPETWGNGHEMATIQIVGSKLLVRQTKTGHRMVRELIDRLSMPPQRHGVNGFSGGGMGGGMGGMGGMPGKLPQGATRKGGMF